MSLHEQVEDILKRRHRLLTHTPEKQDKLDETVKELIEIELTLDFPEEVQPVRKLISQEFLDIAEKLFLSESYDEDMYADVFVNLYLYPSLEVMESTVKKCLSIATGNGTNEFYSREARKFDRVRKEFIDEANRYAADIVALKSVEIRGIDRTNQIRLIDYFIEVVTNFSMFTAFGASTIEELKLLVSDINYYSGLIRDQVRKIKTSEHGKPVLDFMNKILVYNVGEVFIKPDETLSEKRRVAKELAEYSYALRERFRSPVPFWSDNLYEFVKSVHDIMKRAIQISGVTKRSYVYVEYSNLKEEYRTMMHSLSMFDRLSGAQYRLTIQSVNAVCNRYLQLIGALQNGVNSVIDRLRKEMERVSEDPTEELLPLDIASFQIPFIKQFRLIVDECILYQPYNDTIHELHTILDGLESLKLRQQPKDSWHRDPRPG